MNTRYKYFKSPFDITPEMLYNMGICAVILDIDGTVARSDERVPSGTAISWVNSLKAAGISVGICSNNKSSARVDEFCSHFDVVGVHRARKPRTGGFLDICTRLGAQPKGTAVIGDQFYTDVLGALRSGMQAIMVESTDNYLWYFPLRRAAELPFRTHTRKNN